MWTGYTDKSIAQGLALLESYELVDYHGRTYGWSLTAGVRQLPLFPESLLVAQNGKELSTGYPQESRNHSDLDTESRRISDFCIHTTTTDLDNKEDVVVVSTSTARESRNNSDFAPGSVGHWLRRAGVGRNSPSMRELLELQLDVDYVAAHTLEFLAVRDGVVEWPRPFTVGLLIRRLRDGDAAPKMRCNECLDVPGVYGCACEMRRLVSS